MKFLFLLTLLKILVHSGAPLKCYECFNCDVVCQTAPAILTECPHSSDMRCVKEMLSNGTVNQRCGRSFDCEIPENVTDCGGLFPCVMECCDRDYCNGGCTENEGKSQEEQSKGNEEVNEGSNKESNGRSNGDDSGRSNEEHDERNNGKSNGRRNENGKGNKEGNGKASAGSRESDGPVNNNNHDQQIVGGGALHVPTVWAMLFGFLLLVVL